MRVLAVLILWSVSSLSAGADPWQAFTALSISRDGRFLITGGMSGEVLYWDVLSGEIQQKFDLDDKLSVVDFVANSSDGLVEAVLADGTVYALPRHFEGNPKQLGTGRQAERWRRQGPSMSGVEAKLGQLTAMGTPDGQITLNDGSAAARSLSWTAHQAAVTGVVWSPEGRVLYSCAFDGTLAVWDPLTGKLIRRL